MRKLITIILVLIGFAAYAQPSNSSSYLYQNAKWRFKYPIWADSGIYVKNIVKNANQNRVCIIDSVTGKVGFKYISGGSTDTTSLSNRINLRVKYTDTSAMLAPYFLSSDSIQWRNRVRYADTAAMLTKYLRKADTLHMTYTSPLIRQGNNLSAPSVLTSLTAGNGIIASGSTIYRDSLKSTGQYGNSWGNGMYLGSSNNRSVPFRTNGVQAMTLDSNQRLGLGIRNPSYKLDVLSTSNYAVKIKGNAGGGFIMGSLDANWGGFWSSGVTPSVGNYAVLVHPTTGVAFNAPASTGNVQFNIDDVTKLRIFPTGNVSVGNNTSVSQLSVTVAPTATSAYGLFSMSNTTTAFNGSTTGYFVGSSSGQYIGVNSVGSVAYNFLQFSKNGSSRFKVDSLGYVKGGNLYSNSYTPTLTGVTNVSSSQAYTCQYSRVDSVVTVSGTIGITATSNNARTTIGISLPVASNFTAISNAGGAGYTTANTTAGHGAGIYADATNDRVELDYYETHGTADIFTFSFTYRIK